MRDVCVCVCDGAAAGREEEEEDGADDELKTRTPHIDVGKNIKTHGPHPPHTRDPFHRRPEPLYTEKHKVSCPNYLRMSKNTAPLS